MSTSFLLTLVSAMVIGAAAGYLGSLMLSRRMALVAGPLGHLTLPGIALALVWGFDVSLGAFPFVIIGVALIWILEMRTKLPMEALTALVFATGVAIGFLFLPVDQAEVALVGDISRASGRDAVISILASLLLVVVANRLYSKLVLISVSEDLATAEGVNVRRINLVYLLLVAVIVALGVKMVGGLLTAALVAIPAAAARNFGRNLKQYASFATAIGMTSAFAGTTLFHFTGLPAGPLVVLASATIFVVSLWRPPTTRSV